MRYTKACQMESTRMNNSTLGSSRVMDRDLVVGGYEVRLPAGELQSSRSSRIAGLAV